MTESENVIFHDNEHFRGYVVKRLLGKGGLGAVYLVRHEMLDSLFAIKVLYPNVARQNPSYVKRFLREAKISTRVKHHNLVQVHDCGFDSEKGVYFLVMDYVSGSNLREALAFSGKLSCMEASKITAQVASALDAARLFSIVHRDIKPENIMLQKDGGVKLVDLGIAKAVGLKDSLHTAVDAVFGTPAYVSPEQALSPSDVDVRADVYSLGIVFFEMLTGRCPFDGKNATAVLQRVLSDEQVPDPRSLNAEVPGDIALLVLRMCEKNRDKRLASLSEVVKELVETGYVDKSDITLSAEYSVCEDSSGSVAEELGLDLNNLSRNSVNRNPLKVDDPEVRRFISRMKRRKIARKALVFVVLTAVALLVWLVLAW